MLSVVAPYDSIKLTSLQWLITVLCNDCKNVIIVQVHEWTDYLYGKMGGFVIVNIFTFILKLSSFQNNSFK